MKSDYGSKLNRDVGISILKEVRDSNMGWRILLGADSPSFLRDAVIATSDGTGRLIDELPDEYRERVLAEVDAFELHEEVEPETETPVPADGLAVRVTSFEGAKGLSAQHVYIAGLHNGELPRDTASIKDLEICKFVVALTRTRKKCTLICTKNFAGNYKTPSSFISWMDSSRLEFIKVNAKYWKRRTEEEFGD